METYIYLIFLFIFIVHQSLPTSQRSALVHTRQGRIRGFEDQTEKGSSFLSFRGIPYAVPPINELRFKDPLPHEGWQTEEFHADKYGHPCPQWDSRTSSVIGDENCLTLNVFTQQVPNTRYSIRPCEVMFWIHGGAFMKGSSESYGAPKLMTSPIVLVTVNYRLGVLGFLSTENDVAPGNYGMMDLILALHWVQENIIHFGGDPQHVTIFGESAGAAAVSHLLLSPLARGLFWTAITQSGSALCDWAVEEHPRSYASQLASSLNCNDESSQTIVKCLRHKSSVDLISAQQAKLEYGFFPLRTAPVVDRGFRTEPFLPDFPEILLESGNFTKVPLISGVTENEGLLFLMQILLQYSKEMAQDPRFLEDVILPQSIDAMTDKEYSSKKILKIKNFYFKNVNFNDIQQVIPPFANLLSDILIFSCNDKMVKLYSKFALVYMYVFSFRGNQSYVDPLIKELQNRNIYSPLFSKGVSHADDLLYLFNLPNFEQPKSAVEQKVSENFVYLWTYFAQQGTPNHVRTDMAEHRMNFWNSLQQKDLIYLNLASPQETSIYRGFRQFELSVLEYINLSPSDLVPEKFEYILGKTETYYIATWALSTAAIILIIICIALTVLLLKSSHKRSYSTKSSDSIPAAYD